jgi:CRP-like cAMP-binding protein
MADARKLKEKATEAFQKGKFVKAAEAYAEYCEADPKDLQARLRMGDAWSKGGKKDKAIESYTWAAEGFAKDGFLPRAIAASKLILELDPSHKGVQKMLADLYARKTTAPAASGAARPMSMKIETRVEQQTTAAGFAHRKDAIELDARPMGAEKRPVSAARVDEPPSPKNRKDAIDLPAYEIPGMETETASGSVSVPMASRGPSPTRREDAIEIVEEASGRSGPAALTDTTIELDVSLTGAQSIPPPRPSGPDIHVELEIEVPIAPAESFELKVEPPAPPPPPPPAPERFELKVEPPPPPAPPAPAPKVWDLSADEPPEELEVVESTVSEELELVEVAESEPPIVPPKPAMEIIPPVRVMPPPPPPRPELEVIPDPAPVSRPSLEVIAEPAPPAFGSPAVEVIEELDPEPEGQRSGSFARATPAGEQSAVFDLSEVAGERSGSFARATPAGEQSGVFDLSEVAGEQSGSFTRSEAAGEKSGSFSKPESAGEKSGSFTAPPGMKPRRSATDAPAAVAAAPAPSAPRIWLPGNFAPPAVMSGDAIPAPAPVAVAVAPPSPESLTDLERGLQIFSNFDADDFKSTKPVAAPPPAPAAPVASAPPARRTFTELELDGDSLLHAVEAAAAVGVEQRGEQAQIVEEAMDLPDDQKLEPGELPKIPLFSDLPPDAFIALFERCPLKRVEPGDIVIQQGSLGDSFYVICAGSVRVFRMDGEQRREIATLEEGAFFGEMALLSGAARTASVEAATEDTQLLEISAPILTELSHRYPQVASALKKFCRQRLLSNLMGSATLFQPFSRNDRRDLVQRFRARDVAKGDVLIKEGQRSDGMYVILSGEVEVRVGPTQVASLKEGDVFGEMSLLTKSNATASVAASKHTSLLRLPREDFDLIIMSHPQVLVLVSELTDARARQNATIASHKQPAGDAAPMV